MGEQEVGGSKKKRTRLREKTISRFVEIEAREDEGEGDEVEDPADMEDFLTEDTGLAENERELALAARRQLEAGLAERKAVSGAKHLANTIGQLEERYREEEEREEDDDDEDDEDEAEGVFRKRSARPTKGDDVVEYNEEDFVEDEEEYFNEEEEEGVFGHGRQRIPHGMMKLWKIPVLRSGQERKVCLMILERFRQQEAAVFGEDAGEAKNDDGLKELTGGAKNAKSEWLIASAYASDGIKGCVYVEALSQTAIKKSLGDIPILMVSRARKIPAVEMASVFQMERRSEERLHIGQWVRVLRGRYAGDLALVSYLTASDKPVLRVIPRIRLSPDATQKDATQKDSTRPPPKLVLLTDLQASHIEYEHWSSFTPAFKVGNALIEEETGFLLLSTKETNLARNAKPTLEEINAFKACNVPLPEIVGADADLLLTVHSYEYVPGQQVRIVAGDLKGMIATVQATEHPTHTDANADPVPLLRLVNLRVQNGAARADPTENDMDTKTVTIPASECIKHFTSGNTVRVDAGEHRGQVGLVTKLDGRKAFVLCLENHMQIEVDSVQHLSLYRGDRLAKPSSIARLGPYHVGDFVILKDSNEAAVVQTLHEREHKLGIVTKRGLETVDLSQIASKANSKTLRELDCDNNQFGVGSSVQIIQGPHQGRVAAVKFIWKNTVFLSVPSETTVVALPCTYVRVQQAPKVETNVGNALKTDAPRRMSAATRFSLVGTTVKLLDGHHKGETGEIRALEGNIAKVLVPASGRIVDILRSSVQLIDSGCSAARFFRGRGRGRGDTGSPLNRY